MATTPLEREILTHYATTAGPYRGGSDNWTETHVQIVRRFVDLGLLVSYKDADGVPRIRQNEDALRPYMAALAAVPLPVQRWVVPSTPNDDDDNEGKVCSELRERESWRFGPRAGGGSGDSVAGSGDTEARVAQLEQQVRALQPDESRPGRKAYGVEED